MNELNEQILLRFLTKVDLARSEIHKEIIGLDDHIDLLFCALMADGHVLQEGEPGEAKTILSKTFLRTFGLSKGRISMTADHTPSDIRFGYGLMDSPEGVGLRDIVITRGALFNHFNLVDEINRAPGQTQSVLMEPLEEGQVTYEDKTIVMPKPYMFIATMNPIEAPGSSVYELPSAACDRFMFKDYFTYPAMMILKQVCVRDRRPKEIQEIFNSSEEITEIQNLVTEFRLSYDEHHAVVDYIAQLVSCVRHSGLIRDEEQKGLGGYGPTPRTLEDLIDACSAYVLLKWRQRSIKYITFEDIKRMIYPTARYKFMIDHRKKAEALEMGIRSNDDLLKLAIENTEVPHRLIRRSA